MSSCDIFCISILFTVEGLLDLNGIQYCTDLSTREKMLTPGFPIPCFYDPDIN